MIAKFTGKNIAKILGRIQSELISDSSKMLDYVADKVVFPSIARNFVEEGRPRWASLAERTQRERKYEGYAPDHPILERSGELKRSSIEKNGYPGGVYVLEKHKVTIQNVLAKAERLQNGDWNLPARPFFYLQDKDESEINRQAIKFIQARVEVIKRTAPDL